MNLKKKSYSLKEAFGDGFPANQFITGFEQSECRFVPERDPQWKWDRRLLLDLVVWWEEGHGDAAWLTGHTGAGKSGAVKNFCASLCLPMYERTFHPRLEFEQLVAEVDLAGGTSIRTYSSLPLAMGAEGYPGIFCANEIDRAEPGTLVGMYEVLDRRPLQVNLCGLEVVEPSPFFRVVATANTSGMGDTKALYVSAQRQDIAAMDRFWKIKVEYLPESEEKELLAREVPQIAQTEPGRALTNKLVDVANDIRRQFMGESNLGDALPVTMSTRTLLRWARLCWSYRNAGSSGRSAVMMALDRALLNSLDDEPGARQAIEELVRGHLGDAAGA